MLKKRQKTLSENINKVLKSRSSILLDNSLSGAEKKESLLFSEPVSVFECKSLLEIDTFFCDLEKALSEGLWLAGYFSYELGYGFEKRLENYVKPGDTTLSSDRLAWIGAFREPEKISPAGLSDLQNTCLKPTLKFNTNREEFKKNVLQIQEWIAAGETYQVNYTMQGKLNFEGEPFNLFLKLRESQPVPYGAFLNIISEDDTTRESIISLSPELFFKIESDTITSHPMKGTAERGRTLEEDKQNNKRLSCSSKNTAENTMIADLIRNDIGRVAKTGSVEVSDLFKVRPFGEVLQMTTGISGKLDCSNHDGIKGRIQEIFSALFPCGSITGAPKINTMKLIKEIEKTPRGAYCGAIGFISPSGNATFNVPIRTLHLKKEISPEKEERWKGSIGVGCGITTSSDPEDEYREALLKAKFISSPRPPFELLETLAYLPGTGYTRIERHLKRMADSAEYFGFQFDEEKCLGILENLTKKMTSPQKIRILLNRWGKIDIEHLPMPEQTTSTLKIVISPSRIDKTDIFLYHKTTNRELYDNAQAYAKKAGADDAVLVNSDGEVTETTVRNIFLRFGNKWFTPKATSGLLPGVFREEWLEKHPGAEETIVSVEMLRKADEIMVGNSLRGMTEARIL